MHKPVISVENLSKQYRLGQIGTESIREDLNRLWARLRGREDPALMIGQENVLNKKEHGKKEYVWALKNVSFEVEKGEVLGIIGKNGAGKSTLLKILSKVTSPTKGSIKVNGRIASLLEVGTGFHPELSGRENIYLNGAILGMTKAEIKSKFDEIVDFSGVEKYIDTPVKRYSSGMYVRLAFSVAAHLEPEILVVDEVLAVGDAEFQKKAIGKMKDVSSGEQRTVLFVSHNMAAISSLTNKAICLVNGSITKYGSTPEVVSYYLNDHMSIQGNYQAPPDTLKPNFTKINIHTSDTGNIHRNDTELRIDFEVYMPYEISGMAVSFQIMSENEAPVVYAYIFDTQSHILRSKGYHVLSCIIPKCKLYQGNYFIRAHLAESKGRVKFEERDRVCGFEVVMLGKTIEWGWQKNVCVYTEDFIWK